MPDFVTFLWNEAFFKPMLNGVILLYGLCFHNFGLTIIIFTLLVRLVILPLTLKQLHAAKGMSELQPKMARLQKQYANDRQRLSQEQMKLYKEHGVNPLGCAVPTLVQFPIWIGLYQSILAALAATPVDLMNLSRHLYPGLGLVHELVPLNSKFLWLDLALPDQFYILPVVVAASGWLQQKMATMPTDDPRQQQMNQSMQLMMPIMFGVFTVSFASGLAIYWFISNIVSIAIQYFVTGWGSLTWFNKQAAVVTVPSQEVQALESPDPSSPSTQKRSANGNARNQRKISKRGR